MKAKAPTLQSMVLAACLVIVVASIIVLRPYWGLMDDAGFVFDRVLRMEHNGLLKDSWDYAISDLSWGMFRPVYPLAIYFIYKPGMLLAPWVSYLLNAAVCILLLFTSAYFWGRTLKIRWVEILLVNACFFYQYDLLQHLSLQEKLVMLAGLLQIAAAIYAPRKWLFLAFFLLAVFGFVTKASFVIYFGVAWIMLVGRLRDELILKRWRPWLGLCAMAATGVIAVLVLGKIASMGSYTAQYDFAKIGPNLKSLHGVFLTMPLAVGAFYLFRSWREVWLRPQIAAPWVGLLLFLLLFLPWGIGGYVQSILGPLFSVLVCQLIYFVVTSPKWRERIFSVTALLALMICIYRVPTMMLRLRDLRMIVESASSFHSSLLRMPCEEGAVSMERFLQHSGAPNAKVIFEAPSADMTGLWLYDNAMCPLPGRILDPPGCQQTPLYQPAWRKSYRLVQLSCVSERG